MKKFFIKKIYDKQNRLIVQISDSSIDTFVYDENGNEISRNFISRYNGRLVESLIHSYNKKNQLVYYKDCVTNREERYKYKNGLLNMIVYADSSYVEFIYDENNNKIKEVFPDGAFNEYIYINNKLDTKITEDYILYYIYNNNTYTVTTKDKNTHELYERISYDYKDNMISKIIFDNDNIDSYEYLYSNNHLVEVKRNNEIVQLYKYNEKNQLIYSEDYGDISYYEYDDHGNIKHAKTIHSYNKLEVEIIYENIYEKD